MRLTHANRLVLGSIFEFQNSRIADRTIAFLCAYSCKARNRIRYAIIIRTGCMTDMDWVCDAHGLGV